MFCVLWFLWMILCSCALAARSCLYLFDGEIPTFSPSCSHGSLWWADNVKEVGTWGWFYLVLPTRWHMDAQLAASMCDGLCDKIYDTDGFSFKQPAASLIQNHWQVKRSTKQRWAHAILYERFFTLCSSLSRLFFPLIHYLSVCVCIRPHLTHRYDTSRLVGAGGQTC